MLKGWKMRIIKAVHVNGTDKKKRYWKVPDQYLNRHIKIGDEAVVQTENGLGRVRVVAVSKSRDGYVYWKNGELRGKTAVYQDVVMFYDNEKN